MLHIIKKRILLEIAVVGLKNALQDVSQHFCHHSVESGPTTTNSLARKSRGFFSVASQSVGAHYKRHLVGALIFWHLSRGHFIHDTLPLPLKNQTNVQVP